jgi:DNA-binding MarR family transcriptional regulator
MQATGVVPAEAEGALTHDLTRLMRHLLESTGRDFFVALEAAGISFTQVKCLMVLSDEAKPVSVKDLSDRLGLSVPAVSRAVEALVKRGEVKRAEDPRDRRSKLVSVTARGRRTYERLLEVRLAAVGRFTATLEPGEREALAAAVAPVVERLEL